MSERRYISSQQRIWLTFRRNKTAVGGAFLALVVVILAVLAPWISPCDPLEQNVYYRLKGPEPAHPMGVDDFGRDVLSRVLWGARTSLVVGVTSVLVGLVLGTVMGIVAGFKGGRLEYVIMRAVDVLLSFPTLVMGLMVMAILGSGIVKLILAIGVVMSPRFARVAHGPTLSLREQEFVLAARSLGASDVRILCRHIFPNVLGELLVMASLWTATAIRIEANLSFIGLGVQPPTPDWGKMISTGRIYFIERPWFAGSAGVAIFLVTLSFNLVGDAIRDAIDPRTRRSAG